jgi:hypothetical protein
MIRRAHASPRERPGSRAPEQELSHAVFRSFLWCVRRGASGFPNLAAALQWEISLVQRGWREEGGRGARASSDAARLIAPSYPRSPGWGFLKSPAGAVERAPPRRRPTSTHRLLDPPNLTPVSPAPSCPPALPLSSHGPLSSAHHELARRRGRQCSPGGQRRPPPPLAALRLFSPRTLRPSPLLQRLHRQQQPTRPARPVRSFERALPPDLCARSSSTVQG